MARRNSVTPKIGGLYNFYIYGNFVGPCRILFHEMIGNKSRVELLREPKIDIYEYDQSYLTGSRVVTAFYDELELLSEMASLLALTETEE